jgi:DNA-binding protein YbaB
VLGEEELERQLTAARASLQQALDSKPQGEAAEVRTEAAEGRIQVVLGAAGRFERIDFDPRALREGSDYLAAEVLAAVNAALDARAEALATDEPVPDLNAMNETIAQVQDQGLRQMREMTASAAELMKRLQGRA